MQNKSHLRSGRRSRQTATSLVFCLGVWGCWPSAGWGQANSGFQTQTPAPTATTPKFDSLGVNPLGPINLSGKLSENRASRSASQVDPDSASEQIEAAQAKPYRLSARFHLAEGARQGYLILQVDLQTGAYIHSLTQTGDFNPTKIRVAPSSGLLIEEAFVADRQPIVIEQDPVFGQRLEKHEKLVQFFVPIEIQSKVAVEQFRPNVIIEGQVCTPDGVCIPLKNQIVPAQFGGYFHRSAERANGSQKK